MSETTITDGISDRECAMPGPDVAASVASDPLADRFEVEVYANGECDVLGRLVHVRSFNDSGLIFVSRIPNRVLGGTEVRLTREQAIELRDCLDVLIRNTRKTKE